MRKKKESKYENMFPIGHKFGDWTLLESQTHKLPYGGAGYGQQAYHVQCVCGKTRYVACPRLVKGESTSCGCWFYGRGSANPNWRGIGEIPGRYVYRVEQSAKKRDIEYSITPQLMEEQWKIQSASCALSGEQLYFGDSKTEINTNASLDRIDSSRGYVSGNIQWVTKQINLAKQEYGQSEFIEMCLKIADKYRKQ